MCFQWRLYKRSHNVWLHYTQLTTFVVLFRFRINYLSRKAFLILLVAQNQSIPKNYTFENSFFFCLLGSVLDTSYQLLWLLSYDMFEANTLIHIHYTHTSRITMIYLGNRVTSQYSKLSIYFWCSSWSGECIESCFGEHFNEKNNWSISFLPLFLLN